MSKQLEVQNNYPSCHHGPVEVVPGFFCGSAKEALAMLTVPVDTLMPLDILDSKIWNLGFRGEVLYYPIKDFGILPTDVLDRLVGDILHRLEKHKKVGLFCLGGHGRTGYIASVVLGKLGYDDPIEFLRSNYCHKAVESKVQIEHIAAVLGKPELIDFYKGLDSYAVSEAFWSYHRSSFELYTDYLPEQTELPVCGQCEDFAE